MTETIYALYPVFASSPELRAELFEDDALRDAAEEIEALFKDWAGRVDVRGSYSTVGFRADADLVLWLTAGSAEDLQRFVVEFRRTRAGDFLDPVASLMGLAKPAEFTSDHQPAFVRGEAPRTYLCVYPSCGRRSGTCFRRRNVASSSPSTVCSGVSSRRCSPTRPARSAWGTGKGSSPSRPTSWMPSWTASEGFATRRPACTRSRKPLSSRGSESRSPMPSTMSADLSSSPGSTDGALLPMMVG